MTLALWSSSSQISLTSQFELVSLARRRKGEQQNTTFTPGNLPVLLFLAKHILGLALTMIARRPGAASWVTLSKKVSSLQGVFVRF